MDRELKKTIAIIGGGISGLLSLKSAIDQGLQPTLFEREKQCGGLWNPDTGAMWDSMTTNISFINTMISDFPWKTIPPENKEYPHFKQVFQYMMSYIDHFNLNKYIKFNSKVIKVRKSSSTSQSSSSGYIIEYYNKENQGKHVESFDFVIIATGILAKKAPINIDDIDRFKGSIIHSRDYKNTNLYVGKRVAVIGSASSGCEISSELVKSNVEVLHIGKRVMWVLPRFINDFKNTSTTDKMIPLDVSYFIRESFYSQSKLNEKDIQSQRRLLFNSISDQLSVPSLYIEEDAAFYIAVSDRYIEQVQSGKLTFKKARVCKVTEDSVVLDDGSHEQVDHIILCQGYQVDLSFLDDEIQRAIEYEGNDMLQPIIAHREVFCPNLPGLAFVGVYRSADTTIMELQARWATGVFSGRVTAPTIEEMEKGLEAERNIRMTQPRPQVPHGESIFFADSIAKSLGVLPNFKQLAKDDAHLYKMVFKNTNCSSVYRLDGIDSNRDLSLKTLNQIDKLYFNYSTNIDNNNDNNNNDNNQNSKL